MARSQYQYQPLTGPVWRPPVAESLAWLPAGWTALPLPLERRRLDWTVLAPFQPPVGFDPAVFPWSALVFPGALARRVLGEVVEPFTAALYRPDGLQWQPSEWAKPQRGLVRGVPTWHLLDPFPLTVAFDPQLFPWTEARAPRAPVERRLLGDSVEPFVGALYRPEGLQWSPAGLPRGPRGLSAGVQTWVLLDPFPRGVFFDPASLTWQPSDRVPARVLAAIRTGSVIQEPLRNFDPSKLQWLPGGRQPWRGLAPHRLGSTLLDPFPRPQFIIALPLQVVDGSTFRYGLLDQSGKRYLVTLQSSGLYAVEELSAEAQAVVEQSRVKLDPKDLA